MIPTAAEVLKIAASQIGYKEKKSNKDLDSFTANAGSGLSAPVTIGRCGALIASSFLSHQSLKIWLKPQAKNPIARSPASRNVHGKSFSVQDNSSSL